MAKNYDFDKAKALYGLGKTLREIERETEIPFKTIDRRAKAEGWSKDSMTQKIIDVSKAKEILTQATDTERRIIDTESNRALKAKGYIFDTALLAIERIAQLIPQETDLVKIKAATDGLKTSMITTGVVDYYPPKENKTEININSQPKTLDDFYSEN